MTILLVDSDEIVLQEEPRLYIHRGKKYRSLTDRIQHAGLGPDWAAVPDSIMDRACARGEAVHMACHYYDEGDLDMDTVDEAIAGYVRAYIQFTKDCPGKVVAVEKRIVSTELAIGCTPDLVRFVQGRRSVVERKTSQRVSPVARIQTAGQKAIWNAVFTNTPVYDRYGLKLNSNGTYRFEQHQDPDDEPAFWDMLEFSKVKEKVARWQAKYGVA